MAKDRREQGIPAAKRSVMPLVLTVCGILLGIGLIVMAIMFGTFFNDSENTDGMPMTTGTGGSTVTDAVTSFVTTAPTVSTSTTHEAVSSTETTVTATQTTVAPTTETTVTITQTTETTTTVPQTTVTTAPETTVTTATTASSGGSHEHFKASPDTPWNLRLVNAWNQMTQAESETLPIVAISSIESVDERIVDPLNRMLADAGHGLYVTSSYRSYSTQERLYNNKITRVMNANPSLSYAEAADIAATEVARPGTSEHNTGLAVDLLYDGQWTLERDWEDGEVFDWLMAHCHEYGFILRFPEGKEDITGVIYEPWHYRYVGVEAATEIMSRGITLEEYLQEQQQ